MAKNKVYETIYFPDTGLPAKIEKWRQAYGIKSFNKTVLELLSLSLDDKKPELIEMIENLESFKAKVTELLQRQGVGI